MDSASVGGAGGRILLCPPSDAADGDSEIIVGRGGMSEGAGVALTDEGLGGIEKEEGGEVEVAPEDSGCLGGSASVTSSLMIVMS